MGRITWHGKVSTVKIRSPLAQHIGEKILGYRTKMQVSLAEMARGSGLSVGFLCDLENGRRSPSADTLWKLARYFDVPVAYFFKGYKE